jgi:hypothetical protein
MATILRVSFDIVRHSPVRAGAAVCSATGNCIRDHANFEASSDATSFPRNVAGTRSGPYRSTSNGLAISKLMPDFRGALRA